FRAAPRERRSDDVEVARPVGLAGVAPVNAAMKDHVVEDTLFEPRILRARVPLDGAADLEIGAICTHPRERGAPNERRTRHPRRQYGAMRRDVKRTRVSRVDELPRLPEDEIEARLAIERGELERELVFRPNVVGVEKCQEVAGRALDAAVQRRGLSHL